MPHKAHERWLEILKPFITVTNFAEIGAGRCMSMLMSAVPNNELRNGYHVQFVDEIRHTGMQMSLARWYAKNVPDPAGWNLGPKAFPNSVLTNAVLKLGKLGLNIPTDIFDRARERLVKGIHHRHAILAFASWPLAHWRFDPLDERDFEWFENRYPGWYAQYGAFWEAYRQGIHPED